MVTLRRAMTITASTYDRVIGGGSALRIRSLGHAVRPAARSVKSETLLRFSTAMRRFYSAGRIIIPHLR